MRGRDELLHVALAVTEGGLRLGIGLAEGTPGVLGTLDLADAAAATTRAGLDEHGAPDAARLALRLLGGLQQVAPGDHGHARSLRGAAGGVLIAHAVDDLGGRTDERKAALLALAHEARVLREEPVAGMDRLGARLHGGGQDRILVEVALRETRAADAVGLIGETHVQGLGVRGRVDGDGPHAHVAAGANHANGDLAPVRDQNLVEHRPIPYRTSSTSANDMDALQQTSPATVAVPSQKRKGPRARVSLQLSSMVSPGRTGRLKRTLSRLV